MQKLPHDEDAFTQGLTFHNGHLYEGTGLHGVSQIRKLDPSNPSSVLDSFDLPNKYFGEGITVFQDKDKNDRLIQLTWKEKTGFIYDMDLNLLDTFSYETTTNEGWGITYDKYNEEFIVSDGSHFLHFWDRDTLKEKRKIPVYAIQDESSEKMRVAWLNELEVVQFEENGRAKSLILANVYGEDILLQLNPQSGELTQVYDFTELYPRQGNEDVFNGVSISGEGPEVVFVTGKNWPYMYKVKLNSFI